MNVALVVVATGRYIEFVRPLWESAQTFFLKNHNRLLYLLTDQINAARTMHPDRPGNDGVLAIEIANERWPLPTLHRYRYLLLRPEHFDGGAAFGGIDFIYQCDADMLFVDDVGEEVFGELIAVQHPGYVFTQQARALPFERSAASHAYVAHGLHYYCGGFQGGRKNDFLHAAQVIDNRIALDEQSNITAVWHDESHWNRFLIEHPPDVVLSPSYCYPEHKTHSQLPFPRKILALDKNHEEYRR